MISALNQFSTSLSAATGLGVGVSKLPEISIASNLLKMRLNGFKEKYTKSNSPIKSKVSKTI